MEITKKISEVLLRPATDRVGLLNMKIEYRDGTKEFFDSKTHPFMLEFIENMIKNSVNGYLEMGQKIKYD